jgi:pre-mRNA-splicing factor 18
MDFLQSALKDEIEKKKKALQAAKSTDTAAANKKYISRAELERLREKEYLEEQERERKKKEVVSPSLKATAFQPPPNSPSSL